MQRLNVLYVEADVGRAQLVPVKVPLEARRVDVVNELQQMLALGLANEYELAPRARDAGVVAGRRGHAVDLPQRLEPERVAVEPDHQVQVTDYDAGVVEPYYHDVPPG